MNSHHATIVVDLGFGDAGKGTIVDFLTRHHSPTTVVRFNGGAQAAHNVVTPDGRHHTFSQFGSGSFVPGTRTHLSRFMLIDPVAMATEAQHLEHLGCGNLFARLTVDEDALVVTPFMKAANRLREVLRGDGRHGSCGMGIGETTAHSLNFPDDAVHARDLRDPATLLAKLQRQQDLKREEFKERFTELSARETVRTDTALFNDTTAADVWAELLVNHARRFAIVPGDFLRKLAHRTNLLFEGAQGVLIDEWHGFHPYTTWSTATCDNALNLLAEIEYEFPVERLGVLRAYFVRHGPGPFPTEDATLSATLPDIENVTGPWQGAFRVGYFDEVLARYAMTACGGIDSLAITHLDKLPNLITPHVCSMYRIDQEQLERDERGLADYAVLDDTNIFLVNDLQRKTELTDLSYQEALTQLVSNATPVYRQAATMPDEYLDDLSSSLDVPITITSSGRTASEKTYRVSAAHHLSA